MRKLTYLIASTIDGFIAREDGSFDFFPFEGEHFPHLFSEFPETFPSHVRGALGIQGANKRFDTVIMGRKTYEVGSLVGFGNPYPQMRQIVISRRMAASPDPAVELVRDDALGAVRRLKQEDGLGIWLCGGADLAAALFPEIDDIILKVNPVMIGAGIPLFGRGLGPAKVDLLGTRAFGNGFLLNHYRVAR